MKLKAIFFTIISLLTILTFVGCHRSNGVIYAIDAKDTSCSYIEQTITIKYNLHESFDSTNVAFSATADVDWVTAIDASTFGQLEVTIEENNGENRTATITISAPGCQNKKIELLQYSIPPEKANHTLMFCFFGTSLSRYFKTNLEDAATAIETGILGNNNRVVFFRQEGKNSGYIGELYIDSQECVEKRLQDITLTSSIITPEKIGELIATMAAYAPAERYGIVFAGHGQGWITREILTNNHDVATLSAGYNPWIPAIGAEVTRAFGESNVQVNMNELASGIEHSQIELDYILFDACFMSNIESIYDLRYSANYIIASPCEIMGKGFPYHRTLPYLFKDFGVMTDYEGAAESYYKFYKDEYQGNQRCGSIAVYDCSQIDALAAVTKELARNAKTKYDTEHLQTYEGQDPHHFYDFGQWGKVVATDKDLRNKFIAQLDNTIIAKFSLDRFYSAYGNYGTYPIELGVYTGVTTSAPSTAYPNGWRQTNWYKDVIALEN